MSIYFILFLIISFFCLFEIRERYDSLACFWIICGSLVLLAGLRPAEASTDYLNYLAFFNQVKPGIIFYESGSYEEPFFKFIPAFVKLLGIDVIFSFLIFAFLGVLFKGIAIIRLTPLIFLSLLVYYSNFFLLHEMTQIRIGVAIGLYFIGLKPLMNRNLLIFSIIMLFAICFHFSSILLWFTYFLSRDKFNKKIYVCLIVAVLLLTLLKLDLISVLRVLPLGVFSQKIEFYYGAMQTGTFTTKINVFNAVTLFNIILCAVFTWKADLLYDHFKYSYLLIKMYIFGLLIFFLLSFMPPLAFRFRELFEVVQILLVPQLYFLFKEKLFARVVIIAISFALLYLNVVHVSLVGPYFK